MTDKQATAYVVDLGLSMGECNSGRHESDLDYVQTYLWDRITATVANGRKTDTIAVIGLRTDGSDNSLVQNDENYAHISILSPMSQFLMPNIRGLQTALKPSKTELGDGISALVVAIDIIEKFCRKLKFIRNIVFLTNGTGKYDFDGVDDIVNQMKEQNIFLTVLGVDFDDKEYGFKEEGKSEEKMTNEEGLRKLAEDVGGSFGTLADAIEELQRPRTKKTRPVASYKGKLTIGDEDAYPKSSIIIDVERYPRTMVAKPPSASSFAAGRSSVLQTDEANLTQHETNDGLQKIRNARTYQVDNESAPGKTVDIEREAMARGYLYGRTIVPISAEDQEVVRFETIGSLQVIGFIPRSGYDRFLGMSNTSIIVGSRVNDKATVALSSFIHALYELNTLAIARLVPKTDKAPTMIALAPSIEPEFECLIDVQLPFAEDVRQYKFAPLNTVKTLVGKMLDKHRFLPTEELQEAMNDYIDGMSLTGLAGANDQSLEFAASEDMYSPILHRINQVIRYRATNLEESKLPDIYSALTNYALPPLSVAKDSEEDLARLKNTSDVKKVPIKAKGKRAVRDIQKPVSGLDVDKLLEERTKQRKISEDNPIPEFKQMVSSATESDDIDLLLQQMGDIIRSTIKGSLADLYYDRGIEYLKSVRKECIDFDVIEFYDLYITELKASILAGDLGGDRRDFWFKVRKERLGLILPSEAERSVVTSEESNKLYYGK